MQTVAKILIFAPKIMRKHVLTLAALLTLSASAAQPQDSVDGRFFRLFTPLTFYHSVANNNLSLAIPDGADDVDEAINQALLNVYLNRPDLVQATDTQLDESGSLREDIDVPVVQEVELTDFAEPMPDEPEIVAAPEIEVTKIGRAHV